MQQKKKKTKPRRKQQKKEPATDKPETWVDQLDFVPNTVTPSLGELPPSEVSNETHPQNSSPVSISIISWNILAESYCSRRSHPNLPPSYQAKVFTPTQRRQQIQTVLRKLVHKTNVQVLCLQEVDLKDAVRGTLEPLGFTHCVETPRFKRGGGAVGRVDSCGIYVRTKNFNNNNNNNNNNRESSWQLKETQIIRLDDLATLQDTSSAPTSTASNGSSRPTEGRHGLSSTNVQGIQQAFLRRNMALLVRVEHVQTKQTVVIANAHLYWHPGYEYVKLCQSHYILSKAKSFRNHPNEPFVFCGDLNSRPFGVAHSYLSTGSINAKRVAPWYPTSYSCSDVVPSFQADSDDEDDEQTQQQQQPSPQDDLVDTMGQLQLTDDDHATQNEKEETKPKVQYLLDKSLNKFCRWLRILGVDTALETDQEEVQRTKHGRMLLFDRCRKEKRTLVTASTRLLQRRDCPSSAYCINPAFLPHLEVALVHMLLTHGVVLDPKTFLSRCVVCNGNIRDVPCPDKAQAILKKYEAPDVLETGLDVYECDCCGQGYWWCDRPTSSASRVKNSATRLLEVCIRAGVPLTSDEDLGMFGHVNAEKLRLQGWDFSEEGSDLLRQKLCVIDWLKKEKLCCPFELESAYAFKRAEDAQLSGEVLPFTNVTDGFVNTLDYIFYEKNHFTVAERLYVPKSFAEMNQQGIRNGHLLPSNIWPSDHLSIGARLVFSSAKNENNKAEKQSPLTKDRSAVPVPGADETPQYCLPLATSTVPTTVIPAALMAMATGGGNAHGTRCSCGCVPAIPSLFEMAERRKKLKAQSGG